MSIYGIRTVPLNENVSVSVAVIFLPKFIYIILQSFKTFSLFPYFCKVSIQIECHHTITNVILSLGLRHEMSECDSCEAG